MIRKVRFQRLARLASKKLYVSKDIFDSLDKRFKFQNIVHMPTGASFICSTEDIFIDEVSGEQDGAVGGLLYLSYHQRLLLNMEKHGKTTVDWMTSRGICDYGETARRCFPTQIVSLAFQKKL